MRVVPGGFLLRVLSFLMLQVKISSTNLNNKANVFKVRMILRDAATAFMEEFSGIEVNWNDLRRGASGTDQR